MPAHDRDQKVLREAEYFCNNKSNNPRPCNHHRPTLEELQTLTFSEYIRKVVLKESLPKYEGDDPSSKESALFERHCAPARDVVNQPPEPFGNGIAKITFPQGWMTGPGVDPTGRGPDWQKGGYLGDMILPSPIRQVLRGIGGIYEYTLLDLPPMSAAEFREKADEFLKSQVGTQTDIDTDLLERKFWKRLGPTMEPSLYGADMEGTLFRKEEDGCGWNVSKLQSCLELLLCDQPKDHEGGIPGVTTPYLYFGMWAAVFCAHMEDMNLLSINYLHAGAPKIWYAIAAGEDSKRFEQLCEGHFHHAKKGCPEYLRHKRALVSPMILKKHGISFTTTVQHPGEAVITFPGSYHFGFNAGFNVAEATNFAVPEWVPYGKVANVCLCRPDSVRIDMNKFERLLLQYEKEVKQSKRLTWRDWATRMRNKRLAHEGQRQRKSERSTAKGSNGEKTSKRKEFWVEVMQPASAQNTKKTKNSRKRVKEKEEVWHLAVPLTRKSLFPLSRVLCIVPATMEGSKIQLDSSSEEEEDEVCFAGSVVEVIDNHVRIRFDGMGKREDSWIPVDSPKLFADGGRWGTDETKSNLPALHYWREEDSKRRCV
eukprot:Nitzschia sp. Nitz4//scaffold40_size135432//30801//32588//NITZ4_003233-RA/size135432-processed-gene-0.59-mRNA-1//-1//CDS//3329551186//3160//frame0